MPVMRRSISYFEIPGPSNTVPVLEAVKERLGDVNVVVVPVTTGRTAKLFSHELKGKAEIVTVSEEEAVRACRRISLSSQGLQNKFIRERLEEALKIVDKRLRREAFDITFLPFCGEAWNAIRETLYAFGQGMKVAIEISVAAVEVGKIQPYTKVIAVGGTEGGVDTAIIARTSTQSEAFGEEPEKRLSVQEIIAMPVEKR